VVTFKGNDVEMTKFKNGLEQEYFKQQLADIMQQHTNPNPLPVIQNMWVTSNYQERKLTPFRRTISLLKSSEFERSYDFLEFSEKGATPYYTPYLPPTRPSRATHPLRTRDFHHPSPLPMFRPKMEPPQFPRRRPGHHLLYLSFQQNDLHGSHRNRIIT
jgi:hypothetical protein